MEYLAFFRQFHPLSDIDYALISSALSARSFKKNDFITTPGQIQRALFFVEKGAQMSYFESADSLHVVAFTYAPGLCAIPESFFFQKPSSHYLKCITDSDFQSISFDRLQALFNESQQIERLFRKITEAVLTGVINRHVELQTLSIEERFKNFCNRSPHLLQMIPHKYLASYLHIDATNFSKLYNSVRL
jgi:CRP-like cAMP-binding protein